METYKTLLTYAQNRCQEQGINIQLSRRLLLELMENAQLNLYVEMDNQVSPSIDKQFKLGMDRLLMHEPLAHILGYEWFYGRKFNVSDKVLIPREETEELIGHVLADIDEFFISEDKILVADIGTGSGAIAITLKKEIANIKMFATDISEEAILVASSNASEHNADIHFLQGDMALPLIQKEIFLDVCVCNPPYIKNDENIETSVVDYEPHLALFGGVDGLELYRKLLDQVPLFMKKKSILAFEMGFDQKDALVSEILKRFEKARIIIRKDINEKDRMCFVYFNNDF